MRQVLLYANAGSLIMQLMMLAYHLSGAPDPFRPWLFGLSMSCSTAYLFAWGILPAIAERRAA